jgi:hypothetical protein
MDHGQHLDKIVGFDLVQNLVGIQSQFPHLIFVQLRHHPSFSGQLIQAKGSFNQLFANPSGIERRVLGDVVMDMVKLPFGMPRPLHHD